MKIKRLILLVSLLTLGGTACSTNYRPNPNPNANMPPLPTPNPALVDSHKKFETTADQFTKVPATLRIAANGYVIKDKAVQYEMTIDREDKEKKEKPKWVLDKLIELQDMLPPAKLEDVSTVILRKCEEVSTGSYGVMTRVEVVNGDIKGFGWKCEITVIDKTIPAVIARKAFEAKPADYKSVSTNTKVITVPPPITEMRDYLKSLERK